MAGRGQAWAHNAGAWVRWARTPGLDHAFWRMNWPAMRELLPAPGRLTVDVGCGEGRVSRELAKMGHRVVGIEPAQPLADAALAAEPSIPVHVADATAIPLGDGEADLAICSMMLMNVENLPGVLRDVARVLCRGGTLVLSVLHPLNSLGDAGEGTSYFDERRYVERVEASGRTVVLDDTHRPLGAYFGALEAAGLLVESVREPIPDAGYVMSYPQVRRWRERPAFLLVRAHKP